MKQLVKSQIRTISSHRLYLGSIVLLLCITSLTFTAVKSSLLRLNDNYDTYLTEQKTEDFYMLMGNIDINHLDVESIITLCQEYNIYSECLPYLFDLTNEESITQLNILLNQEIINNPSIYEQTIDRYLTQFERRYSATVEKTYTKDIIEGDFTYKFRSITKKVSLPYIIGDGTLPNTNNEIGIFPEFAKANNLNIGDTITIQENDYTITCFFYLPSYTFPLISTTNVAYDEETETIVLSSKDIISSLEGNTIVKYLVRGNTTAMFDDFSYGDVYHIDYSSYGRSLELVDLIVPRNINVRISALQDEVSLALDVIETFMLFFFVFISIMIVIFIKKYVQKNKETIQILRQLGYYDSEILLSLSIIPLISIIGIALGYLIGLFLSSPLFTLYSSRYYFPKSNTIFYPSVLLQGMIVPILLIGLVIFVMLVKELKSSSKPKPSRIFSYTTITKELTSFTLFLLLSILIIFSLSSGSLFDTFESTTTKGNNYDTFALLNTYTNEPLKPGNEGFSREKIEITSINQTPVTSSLMTYVYGIEPNGTNKQLNDNLDKLSNGMIISEYFHQTTGVSVGDVLTFTLQNNEIEVSVTGYSSELFESAVFLPKEIINSVMGYDDTYYNGIYINTPVDITPNVKQILDYDNAISELITIFNVSSVILRIVTTLSIILGLYIFIVYVFIFIDEHITDIMTLHALGYHTYEILIKYLKYSYILMILSFIISIPISSVVLTGFAGALIESVGFVFITSIQPWMYIVAFMIMDSLFFISSLLIHSYVKKQPIIDVLKTNE